MGGVCSSQPKTDGKDQTNRTSDWRAPQPGHPVTPAYQPGHAVPSNVGYQEHGYQGRGAANTGASNPLYGSQPGTTNLVNTAYRSQRAAVPKVGYQDRGFQNYQRTGVGNAAATNMVNPVQNYQRTGVGNAGNMVNPVWQTTPNATNLGNNVYQPAGRMEASSYQDRGFQNMGYQRRGVGSADTTNLNKPVYRPHPETTNLNNQVYRPQPVVASKVAYQNSGYQAKSAGVVNTGPKYFVNHDSPTYRIEPVVANLGHQNSGHRNIAKVYRSGAGVLAPAASCNCVAIDPHIGKKVYDSEVNQFVYELDDSVVPVGGPGTVTQLQSSNKRPISNYGVITP